MMLRTKWRRVAAGLILFGISFGYVEASVVVYLRAIYDPIRYKLRPDRPAGELFPLITADQLRTAAPEKSWLLSVEIGREAVYGEASEVLLAEAEDQLVKEAMQ